MKITGILTIILLSIYSFSYGQFDFEHTEGPEGAGTGFIFSNDDYIFNQANSIYYRSSDGENWEKTEKALGSITLNGSNIISLYKEDDQYKIDLTRDNGDTWVSKATDFEEKITDIALTTNTIILGRIFDGKLAQSNDDGDTWKEITLPCQLCGNFYSTNDKIFLNTVDKLLYYDEENDNWIEIVSPLNSNTDYIIQLVSFGDNILIATEDLVYSSNDFGQSWSTFDCKDFSRVNKIAVTNEAIFLVSGDLYKSTDFGQTWDMLIPYSQFENVSGFAANNNQLFIKKYRQGLSLLDEANNTLIQHEEDLYCSTINGMTIQNDSMIWTANSNGIASYNIHSKEWTRTTSLPKPKHTYETIDSNDKGWMVCKEQSQKHFYFSEDYGQTWATIKAPINESSPQTLLTIENVQLVDELIFAWTSSIVNGLSISKDKGVTWKFVPFRINDKSNKLHFFKNKIWQFHITDLYSSDDLFENIETAELGFRIYDLYTTNDVMYISTYLNEEFTILYSTDGIDWNQSSIIEDDETTTTAFSPVNIGTNNFFQHNGIQYAVLATRGLHRSFDGGRTWVKIQGYTLPANILIVGNKLYKGESGLFVAEFEDLFNTQSEEFSMALYFEDAIGNKDTIIIGYDNTASDEIDIVFGESNILESPRDPIFDARAGLYNYDIGFDCGTGAYEDPRVLESNKLIRKDYCYEEFWQEENAYMATINCKYPPFTISWDSTLMDESCDDWWINNWMPGLWFDATCNSPERYNMSSQSSALISHSDTYIITEQDTLYTLFFQFGSEFNSVSNQESSTEMITLYPNPASHTLHIEQTDNNQNIFNDNSKFVLYGANGNTVLNTTLKSKISIDNVPNGLYFYQVILPSNQVQKGKVVVLK